MSDDDKPSLIGQIKDKLIRSKQQWAQDGRAITGPGPDRGMVFQSYTLFPWLTVRENIAFGLRERGVSEAERGRIADGFIQRVGLSVQQAP